VKNCKYPVKITTEVESILSYVCNLNMA